MERRDTVSGTCRAGDNRNPELGEIIEYLIFENQADFKEFARGKSIRQERQRG